MKALAVAGGLALAGASLTAQLPPQLSLDADAALVRLRTKVADVRGTLSGPVLAAQGRMAFRWMVVGAGYLTGRLEPAGASGTGRDVVEGRLFVGAEPVPWLALTVGPLVRAYVTDSTTERWVLWQARARVRGPLAGPTLGTYVELWRALSHRVNLTEAIDQVQGGEAGIVLRPQGKSLWMRLAYRIDDALLASGARRETVEGISFAIGLGRP